MTFATYQVLRITEDTAVLRTNKLTLLLDFKLQWWGGGGHKNDEHNHKWIYKMLYNAKNVNGRISVVARWVFILNSFQLCYMLENDHSEMLEKVQPVKEFTEWYVSVIFWIGQSVKHLWGAYIWVETCLI